MVRRSAGALAALALSVAGVFHFGAAPAAAADPCVDDSGGGCAWATIDAAVAAVDPGDTILVRSGTYAASTIDKSVTLAGDGAGVVLTMTGNSVGLRIAADDVTLRDLTIDKGDASGDDGTGIRPDTVGTVSDLTLTNVTVTGANNGLHVPNATTLDGFVVDGSHFDGNQYGWYLSNGSAATGGNDVVDVQVTDSTFNDNLYKGIYAEKLAAATFRDITIEGSGTSGTGAAGFELNLKWQAYAGITIEDAHVEDSGTAANGAGIAIKARTDGSYAATPASLSDVELTRVEVSGGTNGVVIGELGQPNPGPTGVVITSSSLEGSTAALNNPSQATVTATGNWWGQASGPATGQVAVPAKATTVPWATDADFGHSSDEAALTALSLSAGALSPAFSGATTAYTASVPSGTPNVTATATAVPGAEVTTTGGTLTAGTGTLEIAVESADGTVERTYTVSLTSQAGDSVDVAIPPGLIGPAPGAAPAPAPGPTTGAPATVEAAPPAAVIPVGTGTGTGTAAGGGAAAPMAVPISDGGSSQDVALPPSAPPGQVAAAAALDGVNSIAVSPSGQVFTTDPGDFQGQIELALNQPVVNLALQVTPTSTASGFAAAAQHVVVTGYWLVAADGGVFTFGTAGFYGSTGDRRLNQPIVGIAATPTGRGYWLVAADGGVFNFGDAGFFGSTGDRSLASPVIALVPTPTGLGYWLVAADGSVFAFGDAPDLGSAVGARVVGATRTATGAGLWLVLADRTLLGLGDARKQG